MQWNARRRTIGFACILTLTIPIVLLEQRDSAPILEDYVAQEIAKWEERRLHAAPGSAEEFKAKSKLQRLAEIETGQPRPGNPDLFEQILYEMKIGPGQSEPSYEAGYQLRELEVAKRAMKRADPLPWVARGPGNVAGRARGIAVDPGDLSGNTWFVCSVGGGIWKTADGGESWTLKTPEVPNIAIQSIAQAASDPNVLYAGTGESFFNLDTIHGSGILKSTDRGETWSPLPSTQSLAWENVARILVDPNDADVVLACTTVGRYKVGTLNQSYIFRSTDGGTNWTTVYTETAIGNFGLRKKVQQLVATPGNFQVLYAAVDEKGILKSTDGGQSWAPSSNGITELPGRFELAISPLDVNRLYASAEGNNFSNLWVSTDAGATWTQTFETGPEPNWLGAQGWYDNTIVCSPDDVNVVYVGGILRYRIQYNGGNSRTTTYLNTGMHPDNHNYVIIPGSPWRILNASDGGVSVSASGDTSWNAKIDGMVTTQFYGIDRRPGKNAFIGGTQDNGTWFSGIEPTELSPWTFAIGGDGYETSWHFDDPEKIIGGFQFNGLQRSLDGGVTFNSATAGLADVGAGSAPFITKIGKTNALPDLLFAVGISGVWRSTDFGGSWTLANMAGAVWQSAISNFTDVRVSRADPAVVWAGSQMTTTGGQVNVSTDQGLTFNAVNNFANMGVISGLATHPTDPNTAYVMFSYGGLAKIVRTTDMGNSWVDITGFAGGSPSSNGFPDVAVYDLIQFPHDPNLIWVGTEIGLVESTNNGATWALAGNGFPSVPVWFLTYVEDEVVVATHGRGIWSVTIPELLDGQDPFNPLLEKLAQGPDGDLSVSMHLRSSYDETEVWVDGALFSTLGPSLADDERMLSIPVLAAGTRTVQLRSSVDGELFESPVKSLDVLALGTPLFTYIDDLNAGASNYNGNLSTASQPAGFGDLALHTAHNYPNGTAAISMLTVPIAVAPSNAILSFDEIAIIEPGSPGSVAGDSDFWDFVVVEGTTDGCTWVPLGPAYDAREHPEWLNAFNGGLSGDPSLFRNRQFDLLDSFEAGDNILVRFRLFADDFVNGWGWAIDNISIQGDATAAERVPSPELVLDQNRPNPFNPSTEILYSLPAASAVSLRVFDLRGRLVDTLVSEEQIAGSHVVEWDGTDSAGHSVASGVYVYQLQAGELRQQRKMTVMK